MQRQPVAFGILLSAAAFASVVGCSSSDGGLPPGPATDPPGSGTGAGPSQAAPTSRAPVADPSTTGTIEGTVFDWSQYDRGVVAGAVVSVAGGPRTTTDTNGHFVLPGVGAGKSVRVDVSRKTDDAIAYSSTQAIVVVDRGVTTHLDPRLIEGCVARKPISPTTGVTISLQDGCARPSSHLTVQLEPGGLVRADGVAFTGTVRAEMIPIAFPKTAAGKVDLTAFLGFPGSMVARRTDGSTASLESAGAAEVRLYDDASGASLQVSPGHHAVVQLQAFRPASGTEAFAPYWYDTKTGEWIAEGAGTFKQVGGKDVFEMAVSHFTWWTAYEPIPDHACVHGFVKDKAGARLSHVNVWSYGADYGHFEPVTSDDAGEFFVDVKPNSDGTLFGSALVNGVRLRGDRAVHAGPAGTSFLTDKTKCLDIGSLELDEHAVDEMVCVTGAAVQSDWANSAKSPASDPPQPGGELSVHMYVGTDPERPTYTRIGGVTLGADGRFCARLPVAQAGGYVNAVFTADADLCSDGRPRWGLGELPSKTNAGACGTAPAACVSIGTIRLYCGG